MRLRVWRATRVSGSAGEGMTYELKGDMGHSARCPRATAVPSKEIDVPHENKRQCETSGRQTRNSSQDGASISEIRSSVLAILIFALIGAIQHRRLSTAGTATEAGDELKPSALQVPDIRPRALGIGRGVRFGLGVGRAGHLGAVASVHHKPRWGRWILPDDHGVPHGGSRRPFHVPHRPAATNLGQCLARRDPENAGSHWSAVERPTIDAGRVRRSTIATTIRVDGPDR